MDNKQIELYDAAKQVLKPRDVSKIIEAGGTSAAVESMSGKIFVVRHGDAIRDRKSDSIKKSEVTYV